MVATWRADSPTHPLSCSFQLSAIGTPHPDLREMRDYRGRRYRPPLSADLGLDRAPSRISSCGRELEFLFTPAKHSILCLGLATRFSSHRPLLSLDLSIPQPYPSLALLLALRLPPLHPSLLFLSYCMHGFMSSSYYISTPFSRLSLTHGLS